MTHVRIFIRVENLHFFAMNSNKNVTANFIPAKPPEWSVSITHSERLSFLFSHLALRDADINVEVSRA